MFYIKNNLTAIAFVVGCFAAFAFNGLDPAPDPGLTLFANTEDGWKPVTQDHKCFLAPNIICVAQFEDDNTSTAPIYVKIGIPLDETE